MTLIFQFSFCSDFMDISFTFLSLHWWWRYVKIGRLLLKDRHITSLVSNVPMGDAPFHHQTMLLLKAFSTASTILPSYSRKRGATTIWSSVPPSSVQHQQQQQQQFQMHDLFTAFYMLHRLLCPLRWDFIWVILLLSDALQKLASVVPFLLCLCEISSEM